MYDLIIHDARIVRPNRQGIETADIAVSNGRIEKVAPVAADA